MPLDSTIWSCGRTVELIKCRFCIEHGKSLREHRIELFVHIESLASMNFLICIRMVIKESDQLFSWVCCIFPFKQSPNLRKWYLKTERIDNLIQKFLTFVIISLSQVSHELFLGIRCWGTSVEHALDFFLNWSLLSMLEHKTHHQLAIECLTLPTFLFSVVKK